MKANERPATIKIVDFTWDKFIAKEPNFIVQAISLFDERDKLADIKTRMKNAKARDSQGKEVPISKEIYGDYDAAGPIDEEKLAKFLLEEATKPTNSFTPSQAPQDGGGNGTGTEDKK